MIDLTTIERVTALLAVAGGDVSANTNVDRLITSVSARIEKYLRRPIEIASRTEYHHVRGGATHYQLAAYPVTAVASIKNSPSYNWAETTSKVVDEDYVIDLEVGIVTQLRFWLAGARVLEVIYTAGLVADTAGVLANHPDLADACEKQVVEEHNRRGSMLRSSSSAGGSTETSEAIKLLPIVREILAPYRRMIL